VFGKGQFYVKEGRVPSKSTLALKVTTNTKVHFSFFNVPTVYISVGDGVAFTTLQLQEFVTNSTKVQKI